MKNLLSLLLGLIIGALIMYFYCCNTVEMAPEPEAEIPPTPRGIISVEQAKTLDENFTTYRVPAINTVKEKDNRSVWFSYEQLEQYLPYAKYQSNELGYTMGGVRIYLGVYGSDAPEGAEGYTTVFMVPTGSPNLPPGTSNFAARAGDGDVPGGPPMNMGTGGTPPSHNYPQ